MGMSYFGYNQLFGDAIEVLGNKNAILETK